MKPAVLALADGTVFEGWAYGAEGEAIGEVVFNTSMSGYQEILTDPSYKGQIVTMTYPLIGNYGVNPEDVESRRPFVEGFVVKEGSVLRQQLASEAVPGGVSARARHRRDPGDRHAGAHPAHPGPRRAGRDHLDRPTWTPRASSAKAKASPGLIGRDLVKEVCLRRAVHLDAERMGVAAWIRRREPPSRRAAEAEKDQLPLFGAPAPALASRRSRLGARRYKVVAYDCGIKWNILRQLVQSGCDVTVVPAATPAAEVADASTRTGSSCPTARETRKGCRTSSRRCGI